MAQIPPLVYLSLIFLWITAALALGDTDDSVSKHEHVLDVSASLNKAFQVLFSKSDLQQIHVSSPSSSSFSGNNNNNSSISITLHPRSSLGHHLKDENIPNNYTSLTISRLSRDTARVRSILSKHSQALSWWFKPHQLESSVPLISGASQGSGEYFARIGVGRPVKQSLMAIDTGSDVSWLQCQPCSDCYQQSNPIFNPSTSSTYKPLSCLSPQCASLQISACRNQICLYQVSYGDGSYTVGEFAIGCGHDNEGLFSGADGLLGLGRGSLSLPSQIKATSFSYCLVNRDSVSSSSTLEFNSPQPSDFVLAPLLRNAMIPSFHYVGLTGISIGGRPVNISPYLFEIGDGRGGVIVDSGTAVTRFRTEVYSLVRDEFKRLMQNFPSTSGFSLFDTCYDFSSMRTARVPTVSFQFAGGKTLPLPPTNYLIPVDDAGNFCFAFAGTPGKMSIIGNVQQQGTRVSYNLADNYIGFSPNKC